jgi:hypothetical protein
VSRVSGMCDGKLLARINSQYRARRAIQRKVLWMCLRKAPVVLIVLVLAACTEQTPRSATSPTSSVARSSPAASIPAPLPTPTDYRSVSNLEGSVFSCPAGSGAEPYCSQNLPASLVRPLHLPKLEPGPSCPTTPGHAIKTVGFSAIGLGNGPVYPGITGELNRWSGGWFGFKTLWFVAPTYDGPVLVRGARIDGDGLVGFGENPLIGHLIIPPGPTVNEATDGYRTAPGGTYVAGPGCYAWQIDGLSFSYVIVFGVEMRLTNPSG